MATSFPYSITNDFPNQAVDASVLTVEVGNSSIVPVLDGINIDGDDVTLDFDADLSGPEVTTLDGLIAAHQGIPFNEGPQRVNQIAAQDDTTGTWQDAATLNAEPIGTDKYQLSFHCELRVTGGNNASQSRFQVLLDGSDVAEGGTRGLDFFDSRSGIFVISTTRGTSPVIKMQHRLNGTGTAQIKRIRLAILPLLDEE